jgi:putative tryptophan/tyrosine transport system substrate-binding protein
VKRREFITLLGGAAAWPLAARAQQAGKVHRIGFLGTSSPSLERHLTDAFRQKLRELGQVEGQNIAIEYRWADGQDDRLPTLAAELAGLQPNVIVTTGTPGTLAAKRVTTTIPTVFASSGDPVGTGLVASLNQPGGNVTGFTIGAVPEVEGKRLELLKGMVSGLSRVALLWNSANPPVKGFSQQAQLAAAALGLALQPVVEIRQVEDFEKAFATVASTQPQAMIVLADRFLLAHRMQIVNFAANSRLPGIYPYREYVDAGGLMSYATNNVELFRSTAIYVDKILKGEKPADLPVQEPTKFDFVINFKTAKALGLTVPDKLLVAADEVIE